MDTQIVSFKTSARRFVQAVRILAASEVGLKAKLMFAALLALLCAANGLNVLNSYVGRHFMTAIADRNHGEFVRQAIFYIGVFAALTAVSVSSRFVEDHIGLLWRGFLSRRAVTAYLANRAYYRLAGSAELAHPDQRIAEDIRAFTVTTVSFVIMTLNSIFTIIAFSGVLWAISPLLFAVTLLYAAFGSTVAILVGRPLVRLNYDQLDKEASFRSGLIHVRENAERIMLSESEERQSARLLDRLNALITNMRRIVSVNRNVGFFTTGYSWMIQIIPALIIAPAFIRGEIEFGVVTQSAVAFSFLVGAFSLIVTQFQSLSNFAAVVSRLTSLVEAVERPDAKGDGTIRVEQAGDHLSYDGVTLLEPERAEPLIGDLTATVAAGCRVLVTGADAACAALFRATAGIPVAGTGRILLPASGILFLAERPYLPPGSLRQVLGSKAGDTVFPDEPIKALLLEANVERVLSIAKDLDDEKDWEALLPLRDQKILAVLSVVLARPRFVVLDRISAAMSDDDVHTVLRLLSKASITYVVVDNDVVASGDFYDSVLRLGEDGRWTFADEASGA